MILEEFIKLKPEMIIYNNQDNQMVIVKSSFIDPSFVTSSSQLLCLEFFSQSIETKILVENHNKWEIFKHETFITDLSQGLMNKLLLKKIMILESKLKNASNSLK